MFIEMRNKMDKLVETTQVQSLALGEYFWTLKCFYCN
jgi:hypothetical protein